MSNRTNLQKILRRYRILRWLRDVVLSTSLEGQEIIRLYYDWSPTEVNVMEEDEECTEEVKKAIDGFLLLIEKGELCS